MPLGVRQLCCRGGRMEYRISVPVTAETEAVIEKLRAGDIVLLSGIVYTARDQGHKRIAELLSSGKTLPFPLEGSAIYYVGPTPCREDIPCGSAGPTTSCRMDAYSELLLDHGNRIMIGKGKRDKAVIDAAVRNRAVYLAAPGGAGALMARCIRKSTLIAWEDLGCEALRELEVSDMPLVVATDILGNDYYESGPEEYLSHL